MATKAGSNEKSGVGGTYTTQAAPQVAITPYDKFRGLLKSDTMKARFQEVLGNQAGSFMATLLNTVYSNDNLKNADPTSILTAAMTAAALGLTVDPNLGHAWIIPYKSQGRQVARFQMGYKGYIQLALRTGLYEIINVTEIYEGERVTVDRLSGRLAITGEKQSDVVTGVVAYIKTVDGFEKAIYMSAEEIDRHAKKYSKSYNFQDSPWKSHWLEMAKKTVIKRLIAGYGPLTPGARYQISIAHQAEEDGEDEQPTMGEASLSLVEPPALTEGQCISTGQVNVTPTSGMLEAQQDQQPPQPPTEEEVLYFQSTNETLSVPHGTGSTIKGSQGRLIG